MTQNSGTVHSLSNSAHHFDAHSDSLKQLSFQSPAWAMAATELSLCGGGSGNIGAITPGASGGEGAFKTPGVADHQQQNHAGSSGQAKHWGLWHEGEGMDGEWDDTGGGSGGGGGGSADTESSGPELRQDDRCATSCNRPRASGKKSRNTKQYIDHLQK